MRLRRARRVGHVTMCGALLVAAACSGGSSPATAPTTLPPATTTSTTVVTPTTTTSTTTTVPMTTTTLPPTTTTFDRFAEIEAIITDLERRRLDALYREDEEAYRELFANDEYLRRSLEFFHTIDFVGPPGEMTIRLEKVLADTGTCVAARLFEDLSSALGPEAVGNTALVIERRPDGVWGYSFAGEEWLCAGSHPLG